jgi:hypothetical protein
MNMRSGPFKTLLAVFLRDERFLSGTARWQLKLFKQAAADSASRNIDFRKFSLYFRWWHERIFNG